MLELSEDLAQIQIWKPQRRDPLAFTANGNDITAISVNTSTRVVSTTCGGELGVGDMISYDIDGTHRFLGEISKILTRPGAGQATFETKPRALAVHSTPNAKLEKAYGLFQMVSGSLRISEPIGLGDPASISATFKQVTP